MIYSITVFLPRWSPLRVPAPRIRIRIRSYQKCHALTEDVCKNLPTNRPARYVSPTTDMGVHDIGLLVRSAENSSSSRGKKKPMHKCEQLRSNFNWTTCYRGSVVGWRPNSLSSSLWENFAECWGRYELYGCWRYMRYALCELHIDYYYVEFVGHCIRTSLLGRPTFEVAILWERARFFRSSPVVGA